MPNFKSIDKEKTIKKLEAALNFYGLDEEYSIEKIENKMLKLSRRGFGDLVSEIVQKANIDNINEMNKLLELLSAFGNILPNLELGGLSPTEMVEWHYDQKIEDIRDEEYSDTVLLNDAIGFLTYIKENKIILTQTLKELKRKDIHNLNDFLVNPDEIDPKIGDRVFKLQREVEARTVHFLKFLTDVAGLIKQRLNKITITKKGKRFLLLSSSQQYSILFETWLLDLDWSSLQYFDGDFIEAMQGEGSIILYRLAVLLDLKKTVTVHDFNKQIMAMLELRINKRNEHSLGFTTERAILDRLTYFGLLSCKHKIEQGGLPYRIRSENKEYSLTDFGRKYLINFILRDASNMVNQ